MTFVVIGSGPAGIAAAQALVDSGRRVTILDAGDTIEPGHMEVFDALAMSDPRSWSPELARRARGSFPVTSKHIPLKPSYGSLFPYAQADLDLPLTSENVDALPSLARGGLSNSWGASVLPFRQQDIDDWPVTTADLAKHYEAVLRFMPMAAERDELSSILPLYTEAPGALRRGVQSQLILSHLRRHAAALRTAGFTFGASRLAVESSAARANVCRHSGMCLYGCPYRSIYSSSQTLQELTRAGRVDYHSGLYVDRLARDRDAVTIHFHRRGDPRSVDQLTASRVFVACGTLSSTRLMLESMGQTSCRLQDSQYCVIPMLTSRAARVTVATQGNTLAQVFLELQHAGISEHTSHLQLYGHNDLMLSLLPASLARNVEALERLLRPVLGRLTVIQGYLHSADSPGMTVTVADGRMRLVGDSTEPGIARVRRLVRHLAATARPLGMIPLPGLVQTGRPGKGNHLGGSFPMRHAPCGQESDTLGRPPGWRRVHLVDGSVLPSVPATTVTFSVMANAHRIASAASAIAD